MIPSNPNLENIVATNSLVCCIHQITFQGHAFSEFSEVNLDINQVESDLAVFLKDTRAPTSLISHPTRVYGSYERTCFLQHAFIQNKSKLQENFHPEDHIKNLLNDLNMASQSD